MLPDALVKQYFCNRKITDNKKNSTTMHLTTAIIWVAIVGIMILAFVFHAIRKFNRSVGDNSVFGMDHNDIYYHGDDIEDDED